MKAIIDTELLKQGLNTVSQFMARSSMLPILQGIKIEADELGITLSGTSLEIGAMLMIPATIEENGILIAPGKKLKALINLVETETVTIKSSLKGEYEQLQLTTADNGNSSRYRINVYDKDEFPPMPVMPEKLCQMSGTQLAYLFGTASAGVSKGSTLPFGIMLKTSDDHKLQVAGTDGKVLTYMVANDVLVDFNQIMDAGHAQIIQEIVKDNTDVRIGFSDNMLIIKAENLIMFSRKVDQEPPNYESILNKCLSANVISAKFDRANLMRIIKLVDKINTKTHAVSMKQVDFDVNSGQYEIQVFCKSESDESSGSVHALMAGDFPPLRINTQFILHGLSAMTTDEVTIKICDNKSAISLHGQDDFTYIIMPMTYEDDDHKSLEQPVSKNHHSGAEPDSVTDVGVK